MRGPAPAATPPTWTQPHHTGLTADHPPPGVAPPGQRTRAARARQLSSHQPPFDLGNILAYRQHQVPQRTAARPSRKLAKGSPEGGCHPNLPRVMTSSKKGNPPGLPSNTSSPSTTPTSLYVLTQNAREQSARLESAARGDSREHRPRSVCLALDS